jgi:hypothetical protein
MKNYVMGSFCYLIGCAHTHTEYSQPPSWLRAAAVTVILMVICRAFEEWK